MNSRDAILIVEDMEVNRIMLHELFAGSHKVLEATTGDQAIKQIEAHESVLAAVLLGVILPGRDGYDVLIEMNRRKWLRRIPVIVITSENSHDAELRAFELGASDVIVKPFEPAIVKRRVANIIDLYRHKLHMDALVDKRVKEIRKTSDALVDALCAVTESRMPESCCHIQRIRLYTELLLKATAEAHPDLPLNSELIDAIVDAAPLHDIGKIVIPDSILKKPGMLTDREFAIMKTHTERGCEIVSSVAHSGDDPMVELAQEICRHHHERWDGSGYPDQLVGDAIPLSAQVVGLADAYDSLTRPRIYKPAVAHDRAIQMILDGECGSFSPSLLACFQSVSAQFGELAAKHRDGLTPGCYPQPANLSEPGTGIDGNLYGQLKYFAALQYIGGTILELDLQENSYQVVYSVLDEFRALPESGRFTDECRRYVRRYLHPEDAQRVFDQIEVYLRKPWDELLVEYSRHFRVRPDDMDEFRPYRYSLVRLRTGSAVRKALLIITPVTACENTEPQYRLGAMKELGYVFAEYNFITDEAHFSDNFHEQFGSVMPNTLMEMRMDAPRAIYEADARGYMDALTALRDGRATSSVEYRRRSIDGTYVWCREQLVIRKADNGTPIGALGVIAIIEQYKQETAHFEAQAQIDQLTVLYNKMTAEYLIERYLTQKAEDQTNALFVMDVDDFKHINDNYGHLTGDRLLKEISSRISEQFRKGDIVGRIGGDEFMILLKNIPDRRTAQKKASAILDALSEMFMQPDRSHPVSASIGISLYPDHGTDFRQLFHKADMALYKAKQSGKNQWLFYSDDISLDKPAAHYTSQIERPEVADGSIDLSDHIVDILLTVKNDREAMQALMDIIARHYRLSHVFVYETIEGVRKLLDWSADSAIGRRDYAGLLGQRWSQQYRELMRGREYITIADAEELPDDMRELFEETGVSALLAKPIAVEGMNCGVVGIAAHDGPHPWGSAEYEACDLLAALSHTVYFKRKAVQYSNQLLQLNDAVFNLVDMDMYIVDEAYRIVQLNRAMRANGLYKRGDKCYEVLRNRSTPCPNCPIKGLSRSVKKASAEIDLDGSGRPALATACPIEWMNNISAYMVACREIDEPVAVRPIA